MSGEAFDVLAVVIKANRLQVPLVVDHDESRRIDEPKAVATLAAPSSQK